MVLALELGTIIDAPTPRRDNASRRDRSKSCYGAEEIAVPYHEVGGAEGFN